MRLTESLRPELGETFHSGTHASGLSLFLHAKRGFSRKVAVAAVRFGSLDTRCTRVSPDGGQRVVALPEGSAHFLEHGLFRKEDGDIAERFARFGATVNASTGLVATNYHFGCTRELPRSLSLLLELLFSPHFDSTLVERERRIIREELRMYGDAPDWRTFRRLVENLFLRHPIRNDIAGTEASLEEITPELLDRAYEAFYRPSNIALVVSGDFEPSEITEILDRELAGCQERSAARDATLHSVRRDVSREPKRVARRRVESRDAVARPKLLVGFKDPYPPPPGVESLRREIRMNLLLNAVFGGSARAFQTLYEEGLVDDSFQASYTADGGAGMTVLGGDTDEPERLHEAIRAVLRRTRRDGVRDADVRRIARKALGRFFFAFDSPDSTAFTLASFWTKGCSVDDFPRIVRETRARDLREELDRTLQTRYSSTAVVLPRDAVAV